jgi:hypothetical protein
MVQQYPADFDAHRTRTNRRPAPQPVKPVK